MEIIYSIIWLSFIVCAFLVWFFWHRANHRERMLRIEKGIEEPTAIESEKRPKSFFWLRLACLISGLSVGLLVISLLIAFDFLNKGGNVLPLAVLGLCGGISMVIAHYLQRNKQKSE